MALLPERFFEVLGWDHGQEAALELLGREAFADGLDQPPSPRAASFFREGEWDNSNTLLGLKLVRKDACYACLPDVKLKTSAVADARPCRIIVSVLLLDALLSASTSSKKGARGRSP